MPDWGDDHPGRERAEAEGDRDADEQLRRALEGERHRAAARRFFEAAPLYRVDFEEDGTVSLRKKSYSTGRIARPPPPPFGASSPPIGTSNMLNAGCVT